MNGVSKIITARGKLLFRMLKIFLKKSLIMFVNKINISSEHKDSMNVVTQKIYKNLKKMFKILEIIIPVAEEGLIPPTRGL